MTNPYDAMVFGGMYYCAKQINILTSAGEMERLTGQQETTRRQIHHGDLSKQMRPQFGPLRSYSAFQLMSPLRSPSLTAITHHGITGSRLIWRFAYGGARGFNQNQTGIWVIPTNIWFRLSSETFRSAQMELFNTICWNFISIHFFGGRSRAERRSIY